MSLGDVAGSPSLSPPPGGWQLFPGVWGDVRTCGAFRLFLDLVAQKCQSVFEPGGLGQLQVLPIGENARSLAT
jgi:hypothetical protein